MTTDDLRSLIADLRRQHAPGIRVAPDSAINQIRAERGLPPISFWPEGVDPLTWSGPERGEDSGEAP